MAPSARIRKIPPDCSLRIVSSRWTLPGDRRGTLIGSTHGRRFHHDRQATRSCGFRTCPSHSPSLCLPPVFRFAPDRLRGDYGRRRNWIGSIAIPRSTAGKQTPSHARLIVRTADEFDGCCQTNAHFSPIGRRMAFIRGFQATTICHSANAVERRCL